MSLHFLAPFHTRHHFEQPITRSTVYWYGVRATPPRQLTPSREHIAQALFSNTSPLQVHRVDKQLIDRSSYKTGWSDREDEGGDACFANGRPQVLPGDGLQRQLTRTKERGGGQQPKERGEPGRRQGEQEAGACDAHLQHRDPLRHLQHQLRTLCVEGVMRLLSMPAVYVRSQTLQRPPNLLHAPTLHSAGEEDND